MFGVSVGGSSSGDGVVVKDCGGAAVREVAGW